MKELTLKVAQDLTKLSAAERKKALQGALKRQLKEIAVKEAAYEKLKTVYRGISKQTGVEIESTTELVKLLIPYTSPGFKSQIGYKGSSALGAAPVRKKVARTKRTRRSNNVMKADLTDKEIDMIKGAKSLSDINPLPPGSKNSGKNVPYPTFCGIKGINMRKK